MDSSHHESSGCDPSSMEVEETHAFTQSEMDKLVLVLGDNNYASLTTRIAAPPASTRKVSFATEYLAVEPVVPLEFRRATLCRVPAGPDTLCVLGKDNTKRRKQHQGCRRITLKQELDDYDPVGTVGAHGGGSISSKRRRTEGWIFNTNDANGSTKEFFDLPSTKLVDDLESSAAERCSETLGLSNESSPSILSNGGLCDDLSTSFFASNTDRKTNDDVDLPEKKQARCCVGWVPSSVGTWAWRELPLSIYSSSHSSSLQTTQPVISEEVLVFTAYQGPTDSEDESSAANDSHSPKGSSSTQVFVPPYTAKQFKEARYVTGGPNSRPYVGGYAAAAYEAARALHYANV